MPIYKDNKRNSWYVSVTTTINGERVSHKKRGFSTKSDAKRYEHEYLLNSSQNTSKNPKIEEIVNSYLRYINLNTTYGNITQVKTIIRVYFKPNFKYTARFNSIKKTLVDNFIAKIEKLDFSNGYKSNIVKRCRAMFRWAYNNDLVDNDISRWFTIKLDKKQHEKTIYDQNQFNEFMSYIDNSLIKVMFQFLWYTGCRIGEALGTKWSYIDGDEVTFKQQFTSNRICELKTSYSYRTITMPSVLVESLKEFKSERSKIYGFNDDWYVFGETKPYYKDKFMIALNKAIKLSKLPKITLHGFRHSHASILIMNGYDIPYVSKRLGHSNINITLSTYTHVLKRMEETNNKRLNSTFK